MFSEKNTRAILRTLTILLNLSLFAIMTKIINTKVTNNNMPIPKANNDFCSMYLF